MPMLLNNQVMAGADSLYATASINKTTNELILKLINTSGKEQKRNVVVDGIKSLKGVGKLTVLQSNNLDVVNSLDKPLAISPKETEIAIKGKKLDFSLAPYSFNIIRFKM